MQLRRWAGRPGRADEGGGNRYEYSWGSQVMEKGGTVHGLGEVSRDWGALGDSNSWPLLQMSEKHINDLKFSPALYCSTVQNVYNSL